MRISDWSSDVCSSDLFRAAKPVVFPSSRTNGRFPAKKTPASPFMSFGGRRSSSSTWTHAQSFDNAAAILRHRKELSCLHRSEEHTSELQSLMRISYAVFCLKHKKQHYKKPKNE